MDEDNTDSMSQTAVKPAGFKVPPPPGYKPKPQTTVPEVSSVPVKKVRGVD